MGRISCPDFVDRVEESRVLDTAFEAARAGGAPTVFVGGEAGIGKSRLVAELSHRAAERDARVLTGGCVPFGRDPPPFTPIVEALRRFMRAAGAADRERLVERAPALAWLLPELAGDSASWRRIEGFESGQSWVFALLLGALEDVATAGPLVVVLEDLHWADRSTLDLVALRVQSARVPGCAIVATYRSDELDPGHPLRSWLAELDRTGRTERLELRRFDRAELVAQLTGILGSTPGYDVVEDVLGRSDGNPFLAEELLAARSEAGKGAPSRVRDIVLTRAESLPEQTQYALRILSAARHSLGHQALAAVSGIAEHELEASVREALGRHVLVRTEDGAYAFRHSLMREAIYDGLLVSERERLHTELARALDAHRAMTGAAGAQELADLAHHWYCAGDTRRALAAAVEAGAAVDEVYAHAEALTQYERALELWGDAERVAGMDRTAVRARAAEAASCLGESLCAATMVERALEELDAAADPVRAGVLHERLGRYAWIGGDTANALAAYEEAVRITPAAPPSRERARVIAALGHAQLVANRYRRARELCEEGLKIARAVAAVVEEGRALATLGAATASLGDCTDGLRMVLAGRALLEQAGAAPDFVFVTYAYESEAHATGGELEEAAAAARPGIELMRRHGMHRNHQSWLEGVLAASLFKLGRWREAGPVLDEALVRGPAGISRRMVQLLRAELALGRGDLAAAREAAEDGKRAVRGDQPFAGKLFEVAAGLAIARRDFDAARAHVAHGLAVLDSLDDLQATAWLCRRGLEAEADRAERARARRRAADAAEAVAVSAGLLDRVRALGDAAAEIPALSRTCEAELERAAGRPAADPWLGAAEGWEALAEPYPRAVCLVHAAEAVLAERRPKAVAAAALSSAHDIARELGAAPLVRAIESIARRGRVRIAREPEAAAPPADRPLGLTPRELDVLRLVAQGYTNVQIANALFISRKTAGAHVSSILAKLGVARRAEAAAIAERLDLLGDRAAPPVGGAAR
jgi:DNA-binding NarL/FixJ family response regulator